MRVLPFAILAIVFMVLQVAVSPALALTRSQIAPQLPVILLIFVAMYARRDSALLAAWGLGLLMDLASLEPPGCFAFAYGLSATCVLAIRGSLFRSHPLTHFFLTFVTALLANGLVQVRDAWTFGAPLRLAVGQSLGVAAYTAVLAPYLMFVLLSFRRSMRFPERV